ncbi:hypothetical protein Ddc_08891 [Ditylenchus destructor]|nr:hypothetical protein Ddc_08891 [Ditylenchus destructor]
MSNNATSPKTKSELTFDSEESQDAFQLKFEQNRNSEAVESKKRSRPPRRHPLPRLSINMSLDEVEAVLSKRLCEKLGRNAPMSMADRFHIQCKVCDAIISINKKMEIINLVRHFQAWHPASHTCSGSWMAYTEASFAELSSSGFMLLDKRPFSKMDFAVIEANTGINCKLQCLWCGVMATTFQLPNHIARFHSEEVDVPRCGLCSKEIIVNARLLEIHSQHFNVRMPDEHHFICDKPKFNVGNEATMDIVIGEYLSGIRNSSGHNLEAEVSIYNTNSQCKEYSDPKRKFIHPSLRQVPVIDNEFIESLGESHCRCKMCGHDIYGAVVSASALVHFKTRHPNQLYEMQRHLCEARLQHVSDDIMKLVDECHVMCMECDKAYELHRTFNLCRAFAHLKRHHPSKMPEYNVEL